MAQNFFTLVEANVERLADRPAVVWDNGRLTWRDLGALIGGCAQRLIAREVRSGDRVVVMLPTSVDLLATIFATWSVGGVTVCLSPSRPARPASCQFRTKR